MISDKKLQEIVHFAHRYGNVKACEQFDLKESTLERYEREYREPSKAPKILLFDIETLPIVSYHWGMWKQNINHGNIIKDWCMLSWSAKWLFDSEIKHDVLSSKEAVKRKDKRIAKSLLRFLNEADVVIAHNLKKFDYKKANTRFILNGFQPPSPYQFIDTLLEARKHFAFSSNRLDYLGQLVSNKKKLDTNFDLWKRCDQGDKEALIEMDNYCANDIILLEEVYVFLRPWMKSHPNLNIYGEGDKNRCPYCTSDKLNWNSVYGTPAGRFQSFQCVDCGGYGRSRYTDLRKEEREVLTTSVAR